MSKQYTKIRSRKSLGIEAPRTSLYDILTTQMRKYDRNTFLHRLIYIGEHNLPGTTGISLKFREIIHKVNSSYCDAVLTGVFLQYTKYFCHVIEGSEYALKRHTEEVLKLKHVKRFKLLTEHHHINQRFLDVWTEMQAKAPKLLEPMVQANNYENTMKTVYRCIYKLYNLGNKLRNVRTSFQPSICTDPDIEYRTRMGSSITTVSHFELLGKPHDTLPEIQCVVALIQSEFLLDLKDLKEYAHAGKIPVIYTYNEFVWPAMSDFVPRNVFDEDLDVMYNKKLSRH